MPAVRPFTGLLYDTTVAGPMEAVTAPPYDTISAVEQERYQLASPYNVVRIILGRGDAPAGGDRYAQAAAHLNRWRQERVLVTTDRPALYPYEFVFRHAGEDRQLRGVVAQVGLEPWGGSIVPHERTLPGPMEDRLQLLRAVPASMSPIYAVFEGPSPDLAAFLDQAMASPPARALTDEAGTEHRLWVATAGVEDAAESIGLHALMIADGHHRYGVALAYREEMRTLHGPGPWDATMMLIVDAASERPPVLPIHRVAAGDGTLPLPATDRVGDLDEIMARVDDELTIFGVVRIEDGRLVHRVGALDGPPPAVCALHEQVLDRAASGLSLSFVSDARAAEHAVATGEAAAAYLLPSTTVQRIRDAIQREATLPQKSTYFWPKPRTGLVMRPFFP